MDGFSRIITYPVSSNYLSAFVPPHLPPSFPRYLPPSIYQSFHASIHLSFSDCCVRTDVSLRDASTWSVNNRVRNVDSADQRSSACPADTIGPNLPPPPPLPLPLLPSPYCHLLPPTPPTPVPPPPLPPLPPPLLLPLIPTLL